MIPLLFWYILSFFFGLMVGSFLNVLIIRLPEEEGVVSGRSHCRSCHKTLEWFELIPLLSYIFLRGRCRSCRTQISLQYLLVELATGLLFAFTVWQLAGNDYGLRITNYEFFVTRYSLLVTGYSFFIISSLIVIFVTDLRHFLILDIIIFPAIAVSLGMILVNKFLVNCQLSIVNCSMTNVAWSLLGAVFFFLLVIASRGTWMGLGDVKLAILMGLFLGFGKLIVALLFSFFGGSLVGMALIAARKKTLKSEVPFGVFLVPATLVAFFWGDALLEKFHLLPFRW